MPAYAYHESKQDVLARLKRIEGQIRGLSKMVDNDVYCIDILTQITAATHALKKVAIALLEDHILICVTQPAKGSTRDMVQEATAAIERLVKS